MTQGLADLAWLNDDGPGHGVVVSTRMRLARNLDRHPFPPRSTPTWRETVLTRVSSAFLAEEPRLALKLLRLESMDSLVQHLLVERHLISPKLLEHLRGAGVAIRQDGTLSIMVNEEDHLRIQALLPGARFEDAYKLVDDTDDRLEAHLDFAFDDRLGYLTACPTNLGTGLRASAMLHLPALNWDVWKTRAMERIVGQIAQMGLTVRGLYGEGSQAQGNLFQLSNQVTLGASEEDIVTRVSVITEQLTGYELGARDELKRHLAGPLEDRVWRSLGILSSARLMTTHEALEHLSMIRLGVESGLLPAIPRSLLNRLLVAIRPANLQEHAGRGLEPLERDSVRAAMLREALATAG